MQIFKLSQQRLRPALPVAALLALFPCVSAMAAHTLEQGASLAVGASLTSENGRYRMQLLSDGKLTVYRMEGAAPVTAVWESPNAGGLAGTGSLELLPDHNLVICATAPDGKRDWLWESGSSRRGSGPATLVLEDDGNLCLRCAGETIWQTRATPVPAEENKAEAAPAPPSVSVGGGRSKVEFTLGHGGGSADARPGFSLGGGSSKVNIRLGKPDGDNCIQQ
jgi:hypothetical protein